MESRTPSHMPDIANPERRIYMNPHPSISQSGRSSGGLHFFYYYSIPFFFTSPLFYKPLFPGRLLPPNPSPMANPNGDLKSPLLPRRDRREPEVVVDIDGDGAAAGGGGGAEAAENPFEFLGAPPPPAARPSAVNPFRNHTPAMGGVYEWCKIAVCLPLVAVRLALFGIAIGIGYVATRIALQGWEDKENPMPKWRCRLMWITRICARCILFSFG